ncbi:ATP-binding cassette domain-containing protein [Limnobaculum zhutongyuii]|uniref:ATP-binding cassette domain-containing protein n=1 Tax=Limnobaculum zhutongyuii TaxID=2498113 RepID=A0A411WHJ3_9GAMM|nr:AAA family ATPase [Limnobaculum zhutongyuii]QBH95556.1 ATP-binding cassette domain-containing protein [Limnobaculum zhutongyuii]TQS88753.1 ATP-binding cassette domain-containing protein [Limnobaculum zhutongyuii]
MKVSINKKYKSIPADVSFDLPNFCIITGKNGSGKSHLLEAMSDIKISTITDSNIPINKIQLIGFGGLNPKIDETCEPHQITQNTKNWWMQIQQYQTSLKQAQNMGETFSDPITQFLPRVTGNNESILKVVRGIISKTSKPFEALTEDDVYFNINLADATPGTIFASQLALVFKTYHTRYIKNEFNRFRNARNKTNISTLTDEQFFNIYGPKPWCLVNEILAKADLSYEVVSPEEIDIDSAYKLHLIDKSNGTEISANDLSTGEKVLMSLALAIYNTQESSGKPDLLILDEPDAPLHPQYSKLLIDTLKDVVVEKADVRVILTTHSPSTAAMCPNNSLFEMNRETKLPEMISTNRGIEVLTDGIPHLKVSLDNRRQIFVESKYDVLYFQRLFQIVHRSDPMDYQPIFLEPHSGTSNCSDVESIVTRLSEAGNDVVRGIVDWDGIRKEKYPVYILGKGRRYSIENYLLDPLYVAFALVRAGKKKLVDFSVSDLDTNIEISKITEGDAQNISNNLISITGIKLEKIVSCVLQNGWSILLPEEFLRMRGHDWETLLLKKIPELNAISNRNGDSGLKLGVLQVIEEFPQFLSMDIRETFISIK